MEGKSADLLGEIDFKWRIVIGILPSFLVSFHRWLPGPRSLEADVF